ncbi:unnamed protein product [Calypogeia fissa]
MPLHRIFHPPGIFSGEDKKAIAKRLTAIYTSVGLPEFYVIVLFIAVDEDSFFVGGKPTSKVVRIVSQHLARRLVSSEEKANRVQALEDAFAPYIKDRGFDWELHSELHDRELWRVNGIVPPLPHSEGEKTWVKLNKAVPY